MNYYERHIGDYIKDTAHLSLLEHGIYTRLLDVYYTREAAIPDDQAARLIGARSKEEREALAVVLGEFFHKSSDGWMQDRCELEIERLQDKRGKAKRSADSRWNAVRTQSERNANASQTHDANDMRTQCDGNALQSPDSNHQTPLIPLPPTGGCPLEPSEPDSVAIDAGQKTGFPDCPHSRILELWKTHLPHLSQPRIWEGNRKQSMRSRWQQAAKPSTYSPKGYATESEGLAWWSSFFAYIATDTRLSQGFDSNGRTWQPDLEWVCNSANFQKIIDGKYAL